MGKFTFHPVKSLQSDPKLRMLCLFGIEGFLLQYAVSLYTLFVTLSNSLLPFFGVSVYTALGANDTAIFTVNVIESAARFGVLIMMILRYRMMKRRGDLFRPLCEE